LPNEKHELSAGYRAALQDGPVSCTLRRAGGLHIKLGCGKGRAGGMPFSAAHPAPLCRSAGRPSVFCAARQKFAFFIWKHGPPARPAHRPSN